MKFKELSWIALACLLIVSVIYFTDFEFGSNNKFELFIEAITLSYLGSYIFYYLNVYLVEKEEIRHTQPFILKQVYFIILYNHFIIRGLKNDKDLSTNYFPSDAEFDELLNAVFPNDKFPFSNTVTWVKFLARIQKDTQKKTDLIFLSGKYFDEQLRRILLDLMDTRLFETDYLKKLDPKVSLVNGFSSFNEYFEVVKRLKAYYDQKPNATMKFK